MAIKRVRLAVTALALGTVAAGTLVTVAVADDDSTRIKVRLSGYQEDPVPRSTTGFGEFRMKGDGDDEEITYRLKFDDLEGEVTMAHIHFGGQAQSGGISAWLCGTSTNPGPAGTPTCPAGGGKVSGTITANDVVGPADQGIAAGEFEELLDAIKAETTYVNVHSTLYPGGEIRSQLRHRR